MLYLLMQMISDRESTGKLCFFVTRPYLEQTRNLKFFLIFNKSLFLFINYFCCLLVSLKFWCCFSCMIFYLMFHFSLNCGFKFRCIYLGLNWVAVLFHGIKSSNSFTFLWLLLICCSNKNIHPLCYLWIFLAFVVFIFFFLLYNSLFLHLSV